MQKLRHLLAASELVISWVGTAGAALSCLILLGMAGIIFFDIVLRALTGQSLDFAAELVGYAVATITFGSLAYAFRRDELIRVSLLSAVFRRHPLLDQLLYCVVLALTVGIMSIAAWYFWLSVGRHWARGTVSATSAEVPMWLPEGLMLTGILLFLLQAALQLLNALIGNPAHSGKTLGRMLDGSGERSEAH